MIRRSCSMCGKHFMAHGNARTCSQECALVQKKLTQKEYEKRRRTKKKRKSTLIEMQQKAREAGMSYGMYMAVMKGGIALERCDGDG